MILLNLNEKPKELLCPHCEQSMGHHIVEGRCPNTGSRITRRFFMGGLGMAAAGTVAGLLFTEQARAALQDVAVKETHGGTDIVTAAPKVHRGGAIVLTYSGREQQMDHAQLQSIADREGRQVIFRNNGVVNVASPTDGAFEKRWESPSLAFYGDLKT